MKGKEILFLGEESRDFKTLFQGGKHGKSWKMRGDFE